jgi:hypothetical protein
MAKNRKQDRKRPRSERGQQPAPQSTMEPQAEPGATQMTPDTMARKGRQKRFGHN